MKSINNVREINQQRTRNQSKNFVKSLKFIEILRTFVFSINSLLINKSVNHSNRNRNYRINNDENNSFLHRTFRLLLTHRSKIFVIKSVRNQITRFLLSYQTYCVFVKLILLFLRKR